MDWQRLSRCLETNVFVSMDHPEGDGLLEPLVSTDTSGASGALQTGHISADLVL